uniref:Uncharacterized protein n=1 Tax=Bracon brevicornis TaxID=1563983 RepID=A0A6V7KYH1_9HYME
MTVIKSASGVVGCRTEFDATETYEFSWVTMIGPTFVTTIYNSVYLRDNSIINGGVVVVSLMLDLKHTVYVKHLVKEDTIIKLWWNYIRGSESLS